MIRSKIKTIAVLLSPLLLLLAFAFAPASENSPAHRGWDDGGRHCVPVGGSLITNFGAFGSSDPNTTLGPATGDLRGAVSGSLLGAPQPSGSHVVFHVQHHWVTESGDTITFDPATATTVPLSQTRFAIVTYPVHITGGTGKFAGATGDVNTIGEVDLTGGTVFRYTGQVCYADSNDR